MKKLFLFAATAMLFAACSNEEVSTPQLAQETTDDGGVRFEVYTAAATRAGDPKGVMTTDKLKTLEKGFGVFAFYHEGENYANEVSANTNVPDFMFNEHVHWTTDGGWTYAPLKYWPNETTKDSQTENGAATSPSVDRLSFFAYAPYVTTGAAPLGTKNATYMDIGGGTKISAYSGSETYGITAISAQDYQGDPKVEWTALTGTTDEWDRILDNNVDLLWGVAPMGMAYQSVNPDNPGTSDPGYVDKPFGYPMTDMLKPDKDQKMKFLFQHALSRIGLSVVSAVDQIAAGDDGSVFKKEQTRVLIEEVVVWGTFGKKGVLNLNNVSKNTANWLEASVNRTSSSETYPILKVNTTNGYLASDLRYDAGQISTITGTVGTADDGDASAFSGLNEGVLPSEKTLLNGGPDPSKLATGDALKYVVGKKLYTPSGKDFVIATTKQDEDKNAYEKNASNNYTRVREGGVGAADLVLNGTQEYFTLEGISAIHPDGSSVTLTAGTDNYYKLDNTTGNLNLYSATGSESDASETYYEATDVAAKEAPLKVKDYTGECYTDLLPRYFMVIPSQITPDKDPTTINVKITYRVITKDEKLTDYVSNVQNVITKTTKIQLENGKSYNLKLILGLTSVKLDATVADWQVGDDAEVWLPRNNE